MTTTNADKQRAYRERKKREDFLSNDFYVTTFLQLATSDQMRQKLSTIIAAHYDELRETSSHEDTAEDTRKFLFKMYPLAILQLELNEVKQNGFA